MKVEPSMPPNGMICSARPPIHRSILSTPVIVTPLALFAQAPVLLRKSRRSDGALPPPNTMAMAASRLASRVVAEVMLVWVP
ncbi:hypothetical protein FQZ97_1182080 [compost metagenome]